MPELPEVETIKCALQKAIGYSTINDVIINQNQLRIPIPDDFGKKVIASKILSYRRIAKYIVINLSNQFSIIWHMGMSGRIKICESEPVWQKHDHVLIKTSGGNLVYHDPRRFGLLTVEPTDKLSQCRFFAKLGVDPINDKLSAEYLYKKFQNKKIPVKMALLDQQIIAGIGNIYASEALYAARISPLREAGCLGLKECRRLALCIYQTLQKAIRAGGSTLRDYHKPDGSEGYFQFLHCVYNKTGQRCPDCVCDIAQTGGIRKVVQGGRSGFYCPVLQK